MLITAPIVSDVPEITEIASLIFSEFSVGFKGTAYKPLHPFVWELISIVEWHQM